MKQVLLNKTTVTIINTILEAQLNNLRDPEVLKGISITKRPHLAIAKKQIKKVLKEIDQVL